METKTLRRTWRRLKRTLIPLWLGQPLLFLGIIFIVFKPLGADWAMYGIALALAAVDGLWVATRYEVTVLDRTDDELVVRKRRRRRARFEVGPRRTPT